MLTRQDAYFLTMVRLPGGTTLHCQIIRQGPRHTDQVTTNVANKEASFPFHSTGGNTVQAHSPMMSGYLQQCVVIFMYESSIDVCQTTIVSWLPFFETKSLAEVQIMLRMLV
ncbi:TPA: hypothetical protein ACH3X1_003657 [Trebouxia sp. C0004]